MRAKKIGTKIKYSWEGNLWQWLKTYKSGKVGHVSLRLKIQKRNQDNKKYYNTNMFVFILQKPLMSLNCYFYNSPVPAKVGFK